MLPPAERHDPGEIVAAIGRQPAREVIVFHQQHVVETESMIPATSRPDSVLVEQPPAGEGFTGIVDPCPGRLDLGDVAGREGGDSREVQEEVQGGPLGGEQAAERTEQLGHPGPPGHGRSVFHQQVDCDSRIEAFHDQRQEDSSRQNPGDPGHHVDPGPVTLCNQSRRGDIGLTTEVFLKTPFNQSPGGVQFGRLQFVHNTFQMGGEGTGNELD